VAVVTGASRGIGRATALALADAGAAVALAARGVEALERVAEEVRRRGGRALVVPADVGDPVQAQELVRTVLAQWGQVDIVVANAGAYLRTPALALTAEKVRRSLQVNFYGSLDPILVALPQMVQRRRGHLVIVSSLDGRRPLPGDGPYAIAKAALSGLVQVLRQELRPAGVGVTGVFPGRVDTEMIAGLRVPRISNKVSPERVARAIVRAIERDQAEVVVPRSGRLLLCADLLSPRLTEWAIARLRLSGYPAHS
jgi:short-subunit dehydrogenase